MVFFSSTSFAQESKHSGSIKAIQFNPIQKQLIASGGVSGEIFIWDINSLKSAFAPGRTPTRNNDVDAIAWNNSVSHILASGSSEGTSIWDLKNRKEVLHLNFQAPGTSSRNLVSSIAWHPDNSTTLATASSDETSPVILLWDLRNSNAPQQIIQGHDKGVLSIDWCNKDATFLLSSGKDNKTLLWDPLTGEKLGDYPVTSNWNFQTSFNPSYPDIFASASFDGKICVQTLQDTNTATDTKSKSEGEDFWSSNNYIDSQHPTVSLKHAPKWLGRPASVSFGFGGKIVSVGKTGDNQSVVTISKFSGDESLISETSKFATALESDSISTIIAEQVAESKGPEKFDWSILELVSKDGDKKEILKKYISDNEPKKEAEAEAKKETKDDKDTEEKKENDLFGDSSANDTDFLSDISPEQYKPSGSFSIYKDGYSSTEKSITDAILSGNLEKAVDIAMKEDRLSDAFAIASRGSEDIRIKVQNAYLLKNAETKPYLRLLYSIGSNDLTDIVANANTAEWKDILNVIISLSSDSASYKKSVAALGDRLLLAREEIADKKSEKAIDLRNSAVLCFMAAESLPSVSKLWISEISEKESSFLNDDANKLTPYSAHVKALHSFIEKITIFRKTASNTTDSSKKDEDDLARLYDVYRDYANIVATQGQLSLAETYLNLVPAQYNGASLDRERVLKANNKPTAPATTSGTAAHKSYARTNAPGSSSFTYPGKPLPSMPFGAPAVATPNASASPYAPQAPQAPSSLYPAAHSASPYAPQASVNPAARTASPYAPQGPVNPYAPAAQSTSQPPVNSMYPPTGSNTLSPPPSATEKSFQPGHARGSSGIFTPSNPIITPYQPHQKSYGANDTLSSIPPPPTSTQDKNKNMSGWNDLPSSAIPPARKITPAAPAATSIPFGRPASANSSISAPSGPPQFGRQTPAQPLAPPPSGTILKANTPSQQMSPAPATGSPGIAAPPPANDKYAPVKPAPSSSFGAPDQFGGSLGGRQTPSAFVPPPNPYANLAATPPQPQHNPYAIAASPNQFRPPSAAAVPPPPSNGFAPPPTNSQYAPIAQPQQPPMGGYAPNNNYGPNPGFAPGPPPVQPQAPPVAAPEPEPAVAKYPPGDRSHIPESSLPIYKILSEEVEAVAPLIPSSYSRQLSDAKKRLEILFDHLNNEDLLSDETITDMVALAQALQTRDYDTAAEIQLSIFTGRSEQCGQWMVGVKRLIEMCRVLANSGML